jgi:hypothetical protein
VGAYDVGSRDEPGRLRVHFRIEQEDGLGPGRLPALPWGAILAVTLLIGAVISAGRGSRIRANETEVYADIDPQPEIEELTVGDRPTPASHWPRARS